MGRVQQELSRRLGRFRHKKGQGARAPRAREHALPHMIAVLPTAYAYQILTHDTSHRPLHLNAIVRKRTEQGR